MSDTQLDSANQILNAFMHRKKTHDNTIALHAQRLVNQFRQLSVLKPEFVSEYNQLLLASTDEVRMIMKDIVGGPTVRQYLDYLQQKNGQSSSDENTDEADNTNANINGGYLPNPDDDVPFVFGQTMANNSTPVPTMDKGYMDAITQTLSALQESNRQQMDMFTQALKEIQNHVQSTEKDTSSADKNAVSLQELAQMQATQQTAFEQMIRSQNEAISLLTTKFTETLSKQQELFTEPRTIIIEKSSGEPTSTNAQMLSLTDLVSSAETLQENETSSIDTAENISDKTETENMAENNIISHDETVLEVIEESDDDIIMSEQPKDNDMTLSETTDDEEDIIEMNDDDEDNNIKEEDDDNGIEINDDVIDKENSVNITVESKTDFDTKEKPSISTDNAQPISTISTEANSVQSSVTESQQETTSIKDAPRAPSIKPFAPRMPIGGMSHMPTFKGVPPLSGFGKKIPSMGKPPVFGASFTNEKQSNNTPESTEE